MAKASLHSTGVTSRLTALLVGCIQAACETMRRVRRFQGWIVCGSIYAGFLFWHAISYSEIGAVYISSDSFSYYRWSRLPLTDVRFWGGIRPPVILLFYRLFGDHDLPLDVTPSDSRIEDVTLLHGQIVFSLAAFSFLAFACARSARTSTGRIFLFALPLLFSVTPAITRWNFMAQSDSLGLSLFAVFVAAWILFLSTTRSFYWLAGVAMAALFWGCVRDTNAWVLLMIVGIIMMAVVVSTRLPRVPMMALSVWLIFVFALSNASANAGNRWVFPFFNIMGQRILPVPEHIAYFADRGMPISSALLERTGKWAHDDDLAFYHAPDLEQFRIWTADNGKAVYMRFLISRPIQSMVTPALEVSSDFFTIARTPLADPARFLSPRLSSSHSQVALICFLICNIVTACLAFVLWRCGWLHRFPHLAVPLIMVLLSAPHAWLAWHGDAMETARHSLVAFAQFPLGFVLLWLYVLDHWWASRRATLAGGERFVAAVARLDSTRQPVRTSSEAGSSRSL